MPPRSALVAGSSRGLGAAVVRALRAEGWKTASCARGARGPGDVHVKADLASPAGARRAVAAALRAFGRLDLLVCAAGDFAWTPVSDFDVQAWGRLFDSNLKTAWFPCREALPALRKSRGAIVLLGGPRAAQVRGNPRAVAYQMAKTALAVFAKSLARAEAPRGVRVGMVSPGVVAGGDHSDPALAKRIPAGRLGAPDEVARAVLWLATATYAEGAVIDVAGGWGA
jgi:NAD(P)-dependent dehydrogenase (short-subunit alcohol dehydrogenase family)